MCKTFPKMSFREAGTHTNRWKVLGVYDVQGCRRNSTGSLIKMRTAWKDNENWKILANGNYIRKQNTLAEAQNIFNGF